MASIEGDLEAGEAAGTLRTIAARRRGSAIPYYVAMLVLELGGAAAGAVLANRIGGQEGVGFGLGLVVGAIVYMVAARRVLMIVFRRRMQARGLETRFRYALTVGPDGLAQQSGLVQSKAEWNAVTEVFPTRGYWIFLVQTAPWFAPKRFFASQADEKAFLADALARMSPQAKLLSKAAVAFAAAQT